MSGSTATTPTAPELLMQHIRADPLARRRLSEPGSALCDGNGDLLKVYSNTVEGVLYDEAPVVEDPNVTIEGYGGSGRPRIGKLTVLEDSWITDPNQTCIDGDNDPNLPHSGGCNWDPNVACSVSDQCRVFWRYDFEADNEDGIIWGAYVDLKYGDSPRNYEHERMTLVPHREIEDLFANPNLLDPATCDPNAAPPSHHYVGPGFQHDPNGILWVRLQETPEAHSVLHRLS